MTDYERYQELLEKLKIAMLFHFQKHTYMNTWKEIEEIKNRNGGMPPKQECKQ